ncbi:L,D-transpeptidase family protein [Sphingomonas sp.]|uniref:L,D-transpeptidase family protein n=1 Tax=Sphingomonas sp. TaxID=28214 RepID=UPI001EC878DF|nr:L,D-transpeptidase family protein [Sphingomonas sp.]MBX3595900.1 L,D-transpeptidase family protein [Sphingomonas sp.]
MIRRTKRAWTVALVAGALGVTAPVGAQQVSSADASEVLLRNGQWTWIEEAGYQRAGGTGTVSIIVSLPAQVAYVYRDGVLIAASTVSTGRPGKGTPPGEFTILQKKVFHRSNIYSNAPMPYMQRLTWDGIALHAGHLPGYPASHGCIRFPKEFARRLYEVTEMGTPVSVVTYEIADPRVRRGVPRVPGEQVAKRVDPPFLRADLAALRTGDFDVVTASNDVIIPAVEQREGVSESGVVFAPMEPVVQKVRRRR